MNEIDNNHAKDELNLYTQITIAESISCIIAWLTTTGFAIAVRKYEAKLSTSKISKNYVNSTF